MKNIVLTGFMGSGKTEVGRELARLLNMELIDVDTEIEKSEKISINDIFKKFGEPRFREVETEMIIKISENENVIISTGGGAVLKRENMDILKKTGIIICLSATAETILKRTSNNTDRPLLKVGNPLERIKELLNFRKPFYEKADIIIDTEEKTPLQIAEEIVEKIKGIK
ncbi:MAG: shikimate kinase [Nitrospirae bacterium RBG_13_39_12]|nr:MAG: shikimate kinase [Nitrospirae bacterium RBG_13_39_12]